MKKVLMIGGTGTISMPITRLLAADEQVELTLLNRGHKQLDLPGVRLLKGDINNFEQMQELLQDEEFDSVINFVLFTPAQAEDNLALFMGRTKQFIFISTNAALNHDEGCLITEESPKGNKHWDYGLNKEVCEDLFLQAYVEKGFPITIVRPTQTYSDDRIPLGIKGKSYWSIAQRMLEGKPVILHGDGQSIWPSTHADDFARFFVHLVGNPNTIGEIFLLANPAPITFDMIYKALAEALGAEYKPVYIPYDILASAKRYSFKDMLAGDKHYSNIFDPAKLYAFVPEEKFQIDIKEGMRRFVAYMDAHPEKKTADEDFDRWCDLTLARWDRLKAELAVDPEF